MALFAISDLHLGRDMSIFGENWTNHSAKIAQNWQRDVGDSDTVIISGDVSWAMRLQEATADLDFIESLPGYKIIHSGNHDYWWNSTEKLNSMYERIFFLKNNYYQYLDYAICGSRGWICPNDTRYVSADEKIYEREVMRVRTSFEKAVSDGYSKFIFTTHFPPVNDKNETSAFTELISKYKPEIVIYGHLHGIEEEGLEPHKLVSADYLNFIPLRLL